MSQASSKLRPDNLVTETGKAIFKTRKGKKWLMEAFKVKYADGQQVARLESVDWTLSDDRGKPVMRIQAPRATYSISKERVEFNGKVVAHRYATNDLIVANHMVWNANDGRLVGSRGVRWTRGETTVRGDRAITTDKLEHIVVEGNVRVTTRLEGDPLDPGV